MILFVIFMFSVSQAQRIVYNTTHCKDDSLLFNSTNVLPHSPAYAMSISSSTYQANKPITIEVKACHKHGIRAFLLKASIQGYVPVSSFNPLTQLGTILVSCGVRELRQVRLIALFEDEWSFKQSRVYKGNFRTKYCCQSWCQHIFTLF